jgi:hypothetical protein
MKRYRLSEALVKQLIEIGHSFASINSVSPKETTDENLKRVTEIVLNALELCSYEDFDSSIEKEFRQHHNLYSCKRMTWLQAINRFFIF